MSPRTVACLFAGTSALNLILGGCAKVDEPRAPPAEASGGSSSLVADGGNEADSSGAVRALPMPQKYPHVVWDAGAAARDAAPH